MHRCARARLAGAGGNRHPIRLAHRDERDAPGRSLVRGDYSIRSGVGEQRRRVEVSGQPYPEEAARPALPPGSDAGGDLGCGVGG